MSQDLIDLISSTGYEPRSYSGRGMMGDECLAVMVADPIEFVIEIFTTLMQDVQEESITVADASELIRVIKHYRTDSMGHREVIYWPRIPYAYRNDDTDDDSYDDYFWGDGDPVGDSTPDTDLP